MVKCLPAMRETPIWSLGWEDPREKEMATHSSTLAWKIPWMEEPGGLQSMGLQSWTWLSDFTFTSEVKNLRAMPETQVWSSGQEDLLEEEMITHPSILAWKIPWTEEPGGLQSVGSQSWTWLYHKITMLKWRTSEKINANLSPISFLKLYLFLPCPYSPFFLLSASLFLEAFRVSLSLELRKLKLMCSDASHFSLVTVITNTCLSVWRNVILLLIFIISTFIVYRNSQRFCCEDQLT